MFSGQKSDVFEVIKLIVKLKRVFPEKVESDSHSSAISRIICQK